MAITLGRTNEISEGANPDICSVDCTDELDGDELVSSATVAEVGTTDLTLASLSGSSGVATVNTAALPIDGRSVAIGKAIRWKVSGQEAGKTYRVRFTITTTSTPARSVPFDVLMECV